MPRDETFREQEFRELYEYLLPHFQDRSIKWLLQDKENVRGLIEIVAGEVGERIDFSQLELQNRSFISDKLREQTSDLLFSVPFKIGFETEELFIYILIEHQSTVDVSMGFRLLFYMMHIWDTQRQEWIKNNVPKSEWRLRPILPIVFYSGDRRWQVPLSITAIMDIPAILERFVPSFDTLFLSVKETKTETLTATDYPFGWLLKVLQNEKADKQTIIDALTEAITYLNTLDPEQAEQRKRAIHYLVLLIVNRRPSEEHSELVDFVHQQTNETEVEIMAKTMADVMKEQGIAEGETRAKQADVIKLLTHQFPDVSDTVVNAIREIQEISRLDTLFDQILSATSFDDIDLKGIGGQDLRSDREATHYVSNLR